MHPLVAAQCEALFVLLRNEQQQGTAETLCKTLQVAPAWCCIQAEPDYFDLLLRLLQHDRKEQVQHWWLAARSLHCAGGASLHGPLNFLGPALL